MELSIERDERYADDWVEVLTKRYLPFLFEGMTILDVGSGRTPTISIDARPARCTYVGLDIDAEELALASVGSYDKCVVSDLRVQDPTLVSQFDMIISWQVSEHIEPLGLALHNVQAYLRPGGVFVAMLSGRNAFFSIINRLIPEKLGVFAMERLMKRPPETVFRAHYDQCTYTELSTVMKYWESVEILPIYRGASYLEWFAPLKHAYLFYEDFIARNTKRNLATHYFIVAET